MKIIYVHLSFLSLNKFSGASNESGQNESWSQSESRNHGNHHGQTLSPLPSHLPPGADLPSCAGNFPPLNSTPANTLCSI